MMKVLSERKSIVMVNFIIAFYLFMRMHIILLPPPHPPLRGGHDTLQKLKINKTSPREPGKDIADIEDKQQHIHP